MAHRHFEGVLHAQLYGKYRPIPPVSLIQRLVSFLKEKYNGPLETVYDVGCGTGQSTGLFAGHFENVVGSDVSAEQIKNAIHANTISNVSYVVSPAEKFAVKDKSIQLVTSCQAAHWFDLPAFYKEAHRVLDDNCVLAFCGYELPMFRMENEQKNKLLYERLIHLYSVEMGSCVHPGSVRVYLGRYTDELFQFADNSRSPRGTDSGSTSSSDKLFWDFTREDGHNEDSEITLRDYINYCLTWSGWQNYKDIHGQERAAELIQNLEKDFLNIIGTDEPAENIVGIRRTRFFAVLGRK